MLDDRTLRWLKKRERCNIRTGYYLLPWSFLGKPLCYVTEVSNYVDTAKFEAKVAAKITKIMVGDLPCGVDPDIHDCKKPHFKKYNTKDRAVGCDMCFLMTARLAVEAEEEE